MNLGYLRVPPAFVQEQLISSLLDILYQVMNNMSHEMASMKHDKCSVFSPMISVFLSEGQDKAMTRSLLLCSWNQDYKIWWPGTWRRIGPSGLSWIQAFCYFQLFKILGSRWSTCTVNKEEMFIPPQPVAPLLSLLNPEVVRDGPHCCLWCVHLYN